MYLSGKITIKAPRATCVAAVQKADMLAEFLPGDVTVVAQESGHYDVEFRRDFGRIAVRLRGHLTITDVVPGEELRFVMQAKHMLAGSANLELTMRFIGSAPTELAYDGTLTGTGLAGRMMEERKDRLQPKLDEMFDALKTRIQIAHRATKV